MGGPGSGVRAQEVAEILRTTPELEEMLRRGDVYRSITARTGLSLHHLRIVKESLGLRRKDRPTSARTRFRAIGDLPRVVGHPEQRWRTLMQRMAEVYGHDVWLDVTYWAAVAYAIRLYPHVETVWEMLPLLQYDLDRRVMRRPPGPRYANERLREQYRVW